MINLDSYEIIKCIEPYPIVTFDVFDTLIKRDIKSFRDVTALMEGEYFDRTNKHFPFYFYRERVHAPKSARKKYPQKEANLDSIYEVLHLKDKELVQSLENDIEVKCVTKNPVIYEVYQYCIKSGKKVFAISDMYLSEKNIRKMLEKCGYNIEHIYVSQEYNASKKDSKLFEIFLRENRMKSNEVIHIGDNFKADKCGAEKVGIHAVQIPNINNMLKYTTQYRFKYSLKQNILYKFINNRLDLIDDKTEKLGYEVLGPVLFYFVSWLHKQVHENNISKLYFLSRDGYLIMKAYEYLYQQEGLELHYLSVSSKSVRAAYENKNNQRELLVRYLKQNMMSGKVAVIDIGWSGRLHKMLKDITADFAELYGFYFGTFKTFNKNVRDGVSKGYLKISRYKRAKVFMNAGFIEILFSDTLHGTTEGYEVSDESVQPILSGPNPNGKILRSLQAGALKFLEDWSHSEYSGFEYSSDLLINPVLRLSINPKSEDVDALSTDFAGSGTDYEYLSGKSINKLNISVFMKELHKVCWKGGFITKTVNKAFINRIYELINPILLWFKV